MGHHRFSIDRTTSAGKLFSYLAIYDLTFREDMIFRLFDDASYSEESHLFEW
jgi:hypothetical protein